MAFELVDFRQDSLVLLLAVQPSVSRDAVKVAEYSLKQHSLNHRCSKHRIGIWIYSKQFSGETFTCSNGKLVQLDDVRHACVQPKLLAPMIETIHNTWRYRLPFNGDEFVIITHQLIKMLRLLKVQALKYQRSYRRHRSRTNHSLRSIHHNCMTNNNQNY